GPNRGRGPGERGGAKPAASVHASPPVGRPEARPARTNAPADPARRTTGRGAPPARVPLPSPLPVSDRRVPSARPTARAHGGHDERLARRRLHPRLKVA